ncbi:hypothetical protein ACGFZR_15270 [Streptomyces sp. NPDC048241]|uniref:hypothetical protein n=1 Tax=Streptomyces sp. NPDC048241 TaxID=3365521 RepID=UPI00371FE358
MADSPDALFAPFDDRLRAIEDLPERWATFDSLAKHLEDELEAFRRRHRQEIALGLRAEGKKWKEIGELMGGVTYQRAHQFGKGL